MNTREQFGNYLLLKKLTEDALGETFRAGLSGENGTKKVVLLRVFNGQGIDGGRLWSTAADRKQIQQILQNPNIGEPVDMGEVQGIPYVAYEYISGKNMAQLLEQAARKRNYIPPEHALLITERVALALAAACESRLGGNRILHGFMIPQLAIISNEGETRLTGFEYSPGLRSFASNPIIRQHFGRYLAPEVHQGEDPDRADDIYSLGVILFELLTGRPLPPPAADGYVSIIDQGLLATEGTPIPAELNQLLKQSLVARDQRINDPVKWQKELNRLIFDGGFNPTTFNLAFFMHNLFRQEIERESQEIEVEKTLPLPVVKPAEPAPPPAPVAGGTDSGTNTGTGTGVGTGAIPVPPPSPTADPSGTGTGIREPTGNFIPEYAQEEKSSIPWIPILAMLAVIAVGITGYLGWTTMQQQQQQQQQAELPPPPPPPAEPVEEEPAGPSPDEIKAQIADLVATRTSEMEERVRKQYTNQMAELEKQLEDSKNAAEKRRLERELAETQAKEAEARKAEEEAKKAELAEAEAKKAAEKSAEMSATETTAEMNVDSGTAQATTTAAAKPAPPPPTKPKAPEVKRGDLVKPGAGVIPPKPIRVSPRFPEVARRLGKRDADVTVKVLVSENGKPLEVERVGDKVGFGFDAEAIKAAKGATYRPATKNGIAVKMWLEMTVQFRP